MRRTVFVQCIEHLDDIELSTTDQTKYFRVLAEPRPDGIGIEPCAWNDPRRAYVEIVLPTDCQGRGPWEIEEMSYDDETVKLAGRLDGCYTSDRFDLLRDFGGIRDLAREIMHPHGSDTGSYISRLITDTVKRYDSLSQNGIIRELSWRPLP